MRASRVRPPFCKKKERDLLQHLLFAEGAGSAFPGAPFSRRTSKAPPQTIREYRKTVPRQRISFEGCYSQTEDGEAINGAPEERSAGRLYLPEKRRALGRLSKSWLGKRQT